MQRVSIVKEGANEESLVEIHKLLEAGGILLYPTDTLYGLGVDAMNVNAISRLYRLKRRDFKKPFHVMVRDLGMADDYVVVNERAHRLAQVFLPGPLTILLCRRSNVPDVLVAGLDSLGIRIPDNEFCTHLMKVLPRPIVSTSANVSDMPTFGTLEEILNQFGEDAGEIGCAVDQGTIIERTPSTIVDLTHPIPKIVREGAIPGNKIFEVLDQP